MPQKRPVFLNLFQIRFPVTAIASILHRISGFGLFLMIPLVLYGLQEFLASPERAQAVVQTLQCGFVKGVWTLVLLGILYHAIAGIRHLCMDLGWGEHYLTARRTAWMVMGLSVGLGVMLVRCLWF